MFLYGMNAVFYENRENHTADDDSEHPVNEEFKPGRFGCCIN